MSEATGQQPPDLRDLIAYVFAQALERPSAERSAYLDVACADRPDLRAEVESLLAAHDLDEHFLERPDPAWVAAVLDEDDEPADAGELLGPYRVLRELGRGGMGTVYLAERADGQFEQRVALKLVRDPTGSRGLLGRFLRERRILARLEHPNIARLLDGGATDDGRPFLAMEYVDGEPITEFCDARRLGVDARLRLFLDACAAVDYAHHSLVVHRDLKPGNILVTSDGRLKLLDFGIAKLIEPDTGPDASTLTVLGFRAMTPEYAAPEQARGEPVTTATDIYALGAVLYELLSGQRPYRFARRSLEEVARVLAETDPSAPSTAAATIEAGEGTGAAARRRTPDEVASVRGTTPERLRRRLSGDLDAIVLTALRREPDRRYGSADAMREDIRRHLARLPVSARRDSALYRAGRFVRRNRVAVAAGVLAVVSLVTGLVGTTWQARTASRQALRADRALQFVVDLFESSDPDLSRGDSVTVRTVLDRGADRLETELAAEPETRAEMLSTLGRIYQKLGLYDRARPLLEEALRVRDSVLGPRTPDAVRAAAELASLLYDQGEYERAEQLARATLSVRRETRGPRDTLVAASMASLAGILGAQGRLEPAESLYRASVEIQRNHGSPTALASSLSDLGVALWNRGEYTEATSLAEEALALRRQIHGPEHTEVAASLLNLATVLMSAGEYERAEALFRECLAMRRKLLGDQHPHVAVTLSNLGQLQQQQGRLEEAEQLYREAHAIRVAVFGEDHLEVAGSLNDIGVVRYFLGDPAGAADYFERVLAIWRRDLGETHPSVLTGLNNLGAALREAGDLDGAERALRDALALRRTALGNEHPDVGQSLNNLAELLVRKGEYVEAEADYRAALANWRAALGRDHPTVAFALVGLGGLMRLQQHCDEAEPVLGEALAIRLANLEEQSIEVAHARLEMGSCLLDLGRLAEAEPLLLASYPVLEQNRGEADEYTLRARAALAGLYTAWGRPDEARRYSR